MDFTTQISWYYTTESRHCFTVGFLSGLIITATALIMLWFASPVSILKGLSILLLAGGLLFMIGGYSAGSSAKKSLPKKIQQYQTNQKTFIEEEYLKVEGIHKSWLGIRIFWSLFLILGVILIFATTKTFWVGIAIGSLIIGTIGHIEEAISFQHNEKYRNEVQKEKTTLTNQLNKSAF